MDTTDHCPRCAGPQSPRPAVSRKDNSTAVCSTCGTKEALLEFAGEDPWPTFPEALPHGN